MRADFLNTSAERPDPSVVAIGDADGPELFFNREMSWLNFNWRVLEEAAAGGLEELWLGLESISPAVRDRMDKGVSQPVIERIVRDASEVGIRVRALCILGYPGESIEEARATLDWLEASARLRMLFEIPAAFSSPCANWTDWLPPLTKTSPLV